MRPEFLSHMQMDSAEAAVEGTSAACNHRYSSVLEAPVPNLLRIQILVHIHQIVGWVGQIIQILNKWPNWIYCNLCLLGGRRYPNFAELFFALKCLSNLKHCMFTLAHNRNIHVLGFFKKLFGNQGYVWTAHYC